MLCYIMIVDGSVDVIPVVVDLNTFTHVTVRNRRLSRNLLMKYYFEHTIDGKRMVIFMIPEDVFYNTVQEK